jgi:hypothetical protein
LIDTAGIHHREFRGISPALRTPYFDHDGISFSDMFQQVIAGSRRQ